MSTEEPQARRRSPPIGAFLVLLVAILFYAGMVACLNDAHNPGEDAFSRGLSVFFAAVFGAVLWVLLGLLLLIGWLRGEMPRWGAIAALLLLPLSALAAGIAADPGEDAPWWMQLVPFLLPLPIAGYAIWARLPGLHRTLPAEATSAALLGAVLVLTLAPMPRFVIQQVEEAARQAEELRAAEQAARAEEERRRANLARLQQLTAASPLWEWAAFIGRDSELDAQAIAGARQLNHRQADAEAMLRRNQGFPLAEFERLDLSITPEFCTAAANFLRRDAAEHPAAGPDAAFRAVEGYFDPYLGAIESLTQGKCDIDDAVARIRETIGGYPPTPSRDAFLAVLAWRRGNGFHKRDAKDLALKDYDAAIELRPDNEQFRASRAQVYYELAQYDTAIADYDEAIRVNPGYTGALFGRGNAYYAKGDDDRAMADYDEALRRNPEFAEAYNNRGNLFVRRNELDRALQDFDQALRLAPKFRIALSNRGRTRFYQASYEPAAADFAAVLPLNPTDAYTVLWLHLARSRTGQATPDALRDDAAKLDRNEWPWPIVAAYIGETEKNLVLADIQRLGGSERYGRECEADFYFGALAASNHDAAAARDLLQRAVDICPINFIERVAARYELGRLTP
jgi:lipoprotein NlpI